MSMNEHLRDAGMTAMLLFALACTVVAGDDDKKMTEGIAASYLATLVSVEIVPENGAPRPVGSAFLVLTTNKHVLLVTAKHVVVDEHGQSRPNLAYRFNRNQGPSELITDSFMRTNNVQGWFFSATADVACRFIAYHTDAHINNLPLDMFLAAARIQPGAPVLVPGFPMGIRSTEYANPIVRRGVVARVEANHIILDAFVFPGNSGGPVFYVPTVKFGDGIDKPFINQDCLIGLVSQSISYVDTAVSLQTQKPRVTFEENAGLCNVVPADAILALINREDVRRLDSTLTEIE